MRAHALEIDYREGTPVAPRHDAVRVSPVKKRPPASSVSSKRGLVTYHDQSVPSAGDGDVCAAPVREEADAAAAVGAHAGHDDDRFFSPLKPVHGAALQAVTRAQLPAEQPDLASVWCDHADLLPREPSRQQPLHHPDHDLDFVLVDF
jgi:hypothetical protein